MATRFSIFPSVDSGGGDDRVYNAVDFLARPSQDFLAGEGDGVSREVGNAMAVTETSPASLAVSIDTGSCRANGYRFEVHTAAEELSLSAADPSDDRIDRIVVQARLDSPNRDMRLTVLEGTPAASPSPPALTRTADTYEISLAQVQVSVGASFIEDGSITDERGDTSVCGWLRAQDSKLLDGRSRAELNVFEPPLTTSPINPGEYKVALGDDVNTGGTFVVDIHASSDNIAPTLQITDGNPSAALAIVTVTGAAYAGMLEARAHRFQYDGTNYVVLDPAGGVVEKASNANGEYVRFEDGTQLARSTVTLTFLGGAALDATWTFPAAFDEAPQVSHTVNIFSGAYTPNSGELTVSGISALSASSATLDQRRISDGTNFQSGDTIDTQAFAIGEWS